MIILILVTLVFAIGIIAMLFDGMHLSGIFKKLPVQISVADKGPLKMFYESKKK